MRNRSAHITVAVRGLALILAVTFTGQAVMTIGATTPAVAAGAYPLR